MKSKFVKLLGVGLTLVLALSMLLASMPVSGAVGVLKWDTVTSPGAKSGFMIEGGDVDYLAVAPDGKTMFAYNNGDTTLYKSTDAGVTWTTSSIGDTLEGNAIVALAVSPDYASDSSIVAAGAQKVWVSINGGTSFGERGTAELATVAFGGAAANSGITSLSVTDYYLGGQLAVLVGTADPDATQFGKVVLYRSDNAAWTDQIADVLDYGAVAFSPNHKTDGGIVAVGHNEDIVYVISKFGTAAWDDSVDDVAIDKANAFDPTSATLAFFDDYEWSSNNRLLIGTAGDADYDDIYLIKGALSGGSSTATDLNVGGSDTQTEVKSIAIAGNFVGGSVFVGQMNSTSVKRTADASVSSVTWSSSVKSQLGATGTDVTLVESPTFSTDNTVYAASSDGTGATGTSFSVSKDGGVIFNQTGLISVSDISDSTVIDYLDLAVVDKNTMFLVVADTGAAATTMEMVLRTTDAGATWQRVWMDDDLAVVKASPTYATDKTVYVAENGTTRIWKSTDGGDRWVGLAAAANITAFGLLDKDTYYVGAGTDIYMSGAWVAGTITGNAESIYPVDKDTVIVGNDDGSVFLSTNASASSSIKYTRQGAVQELGVGADIRVIADKDYATSKFIYAASDDATEGVNRWKVGDSSTWTQMDDDTNTLAASGIAQAKDASLYASSATADKGVRRHLDPAGTKAAQDWESMVSGLPANATLHDLEYIAGSNILYAIAGAVEFSDVEHDFRILAFEDTLSVTVALTAPKDKSVTGTSVTLTWTAVTVPTGTTVTYVVDVAYDDKFANKVVTAQETTGTSYKVTGLTAGETYYWRAYVKAGSPLLSRKPSMSFLVKLGAPTLQSPEYGLQTSLKRPTFSWLAVAGAASYELELADNPFYANSKVKKPLEHTVYTWDEDLTPATTYYWRVRAISGSNSSSWTEAIFTIAAEPTKVAPPVTITSAPTLPPIIIEQPQAPAYVWVIIGVGAILVIAVIILIVRTRRVT